MRNLMTIVVNSQSYVFNFCSGVLCYARAKQQISIHYWIWKCCFVDDRAATKWKRVPPDLLSCCFARNRFLFINFSLLFFAMPFVALLDDDMIDSSDRSDVKVTEELFRRQTESKSCLLSHKQERKWSDKVKCFLAYKFEFIIIDYDDDVLPILFFFDWAV